MAVSLTVSETYEGAEYADELLPAGGTEVGVDLGQVTNGSYAPLTVQDPDNTGHQSIFIAHDGVQPITSLKVYMNSGYAAATGYTYGGARDEATDYNNLISEGDVSGTVKNNVGGLSGGFWMDFDSDASTTNQFDSANSTVEIFKTGNGDTLVNAITIPASAMITDGALGQPSAPVAGSIGANGDAVLGDSAYIKARIYARTAYTNGGYHQFALTFTYTHTS